MLTYIYHIALYELFYDRPFRRCFCFEVAEKAEKRSIRRQNAGVEKAAWIFGFYSFSACKKASKWIGWSYR